MFAKMPWTEALRSIVRKPEAFRDENPELFIDEECIMVRGPVVSLQGCTKRFLKESMKWFHRTIL